MSENEALAAARTAFLQRDWAAAREQFKIVTDLPVADLADLATACFWLGAVEESIQTNQDVHRRCAADGAMAHAAMAALQVGYCESLRGHLDVGAGWLARSRRFFEDIPDAPERGYLLSVDAETAIRAGQDTIAELLAEQVLEWGEQHDDRTLQAHGLFAQGELAIHRGEMEHARRCLDEAMILVRGGTVRPEWAGNLYCRMIQLCFELSDVPRAQHWTVMAEAWSKGYAPGAMFTGICRVHRVQLLQVQGEWNRAVQDAEQAAAELEPLDVTVAAEAHYRIGELQRLRGNFDAAESAYRGAHERGRDPVPGIALLHLYRGHVRVAESILDAVLAVEHKPLARAPLLAARIEVALTAGNVDDAVRGVEELTSISADHESPGWLATAQRWHGAVLHSQGRNAEAIGVLREARQQWQHMDAPYLVARIRLDLADAADELGDHDTADRERDQARIALQRLGARRDLARLSVHRGNGRAEGLSSREVEVIAVIAAGISNREAAAQLHISERTVARHLANVYLKTDSSSRTAAVTWARERGLV